MINKNLKYETSENINIFAQDESGHLRPSIPKAGANEQCYIALSMPSLPKNPRIKSAKLVLTQKTAPASAEDVGGLCLYSLAMPPSGDATPPPETDLLDHRAVKIGDEVAYTFDLTKVVDVLLASVQSTFGVTLKGRNEESQSCCTFYEEGDFAPRFTIDYEVDHAVNIANHTLSQDFGRFGRGAVDLAKGNLMLEMEEYSWGGNRMPVTIKRLYNSALAALQFTANPAAHLFTADFSAMNCGFGWRLNLMQSMVPAAFDLEGTSYEGYIRMDEAGDETYFIPSGDQFILFDDKEVQYDPINRILDLGGETHHFDEAGRLVKIVDENGNELNITYETGRIKKITDGVGRTFRFSYGSNGCLNSITAPDGTFSYYYYEGGRLTGIEYADMKMSSFEYSNGKLSSVQFHNTYGSDPIRKFTYEYSADRVFRVTEYGEEEGALLKGITQSIDCFANRILLETLEPAEGEEYQAPVKTAYCFDADGDVCSEYTYTEEQGNVGINGGSGIQPHGAEKNGGIISNVNNLLTNHGFESMDGWHPVKNVGSSLSLQNKENKSIPEFSGKSLLMWSTEGGNGEGIGQTIQTLPAGQYTFSTYGCGAYGAVGIGDAEVYLRVVDFAGDLIAQSERVKYRWFEQFRLALPFEIPTDQEVTVQILMDAPRMSMVYFDHAQLENNGFANPYNALENGNFERDLSGWTVSGERIEASTEICFNMSKALRIQGDLAAPKSVGQSVPVAAEASTRETFALSGWAKAFSIPTEDRGEEQQPTFRLRAVLHYDGEEADETFTADFRSAADEWQLASVEFSKSKYAPLANVEVFCEYDYNYGAAFFDDIQLIRSNIETDLSAEDFMADDAEEQADPAEETLDAANPPAGTQIGAAAEFEELLDQFGNTLTETTFTEGEFGTVYRSFGFSENGNELIRETDARGNETRYEVDPATSKVQKTIDRCGNQTEYTYDQSGNMNSINSKDAAGNSLANVYYDYDLFGNVETIFRGDGLQYVLEQDGFRNIQTIGIGGKPEKLISYGYKKGTDRLKSITYANGDTMKATYDSIGRMIAEKWFDAADTLTAHYKYVYDGEGNIVRSIDILQGKEYNYYYKEGTLIRCAESAVTLDSWGNVIQKTVLHSVTFEYDKEGALIKKHILPADGESRTIFFEQTEGDAAVLKFKAGAQDVVAHAKTDAFGRKEFDELQLGTGFVSRQFDYLVGQVTEEHRDGQKLKSSPTTQLVSRITFSDGRTIDYEYDAEERITKVVDSLDGTTEYTYDALGQLLTETINGVAKNTMTYDNYGNILSKNGVAYGYNNVVWKDLLTSFDGAPIFYDAQGNPTSYLGHYLAWEKGRQLRMFDDWEFTYNANGIRTSKKLFDLEHTYELEGAKILREKWGANELIPLYDGSEEVCGIVYNGNPFYFQKNLQGDILAIIDQNAETVARYSYDAWGVCTVKSDTSDCNIASVNPFRYRGYYYDTETGLYYLQSRYYDPIVGRFLNADEANYLGNSGEVVTYNVFVYCENIPVIYSDNMGFSTWSYLSKIIDQLSKGISKLSSHLINLYGLSKKLYEHKKKYNNTTKIMRFVNDNKASIKKLGRYATKTNFLIECISIFIDCKDIIKKSNSTFVAFGNIVCYALIKVIGRTVNKIVSIIVSKVFTVLCWARFILEYLLNAMVDLFMGSSFITKMCSKFVNYLDKNKLNIANCFVAMLKSARSCFA